jgi:N-acetylneuraminic acid mutarotase
MGSAFGGKFYVAGGTHNGRLDVYDPVTNEWTTKASMPTERSLGASAAVGGKLYVIGGIQYQANGLERPVRTTSVYDPRTDKWTVAAQMPNARYAMAASRVVINGQVRIQVVGYTRPGNNLQLVP